MTSHSIAAVIGDSILPSAIRVEALSLQIDILSMHDIDSLLPTVTSTHGFHFTFTDSNVKTLSLF